MSDTPYIAVVSDMDGTFLQPDHTVSTYTQEVMERLQSTRQVPFLFATGRHHVDVFATARKVGLVGYIVTSNGARAHDPQGNVILRQDMDPTIARELACIALDSEEITTCVFQEDDWYTDRDTPAITELYQENKDVYFPRIFNPRTFASYAGVYKVYYTSTNYTLLAVLEQQIKDTYGAAVSVAYSLPDCMEVMAAGVNKGMALAKVLKESIFPNDPRTGEELLKSCICFGDGENDAQMLMMAGAGCVMENAQDRLLCLLPLDTDPHLHRVGSNAENAVAKKLVEVFQLE
ncbi:Sucrose-6F-phosphate phosphohydrolase/haloacid dehalogenase-like hydrolase [Novymonas esmeraldas]|uniref:Sucrose-6F-phosphate phosphohydrolase/haloacid dehalogenase-like hydrolase n=1 Tax=Novymonas esmeraldas TaxID=1808958 RepID=A0AAW0ETR8_9TRYP